MARAITIGNGNLLVGLDHRGLVRDFYFPFVGHSNHVSGASGSYVHRIGVWIDCSLSWLSDPAWDIEVHPSVEGVTNTIFATNDALHIKLVFNDVVHNEHNVFIRKITIHNLTREEREVRMFFGQEFRISESRRGDTAFYDPRVRSVIHYKGHNAFLIHATVNGVPFSDYTVGLFDIEGKAGSYTDAEDGILSQNAIEHGSVDSVIGVTAVVPAEGSTIVYYWIAAAESVKKVHALHRTVYEEQPERLIVSTENYWRAWINKESSDLSLIEKHLQSLYRRSLQIIRVHTDNRGGIIASSDSDMLNQGRDSYSYVWPRDAALSAHALDVAHYFDTTERFFRFVAPLIEHDGYLMHKYRVDGVLGSSWHPWVRGGQPELPIQEDETALVVGMIAKHYALAKDIEFIESLYNSFIEPASDFMCGYTEIETGLPAASYDLWEEKYGTSTYTACAVYGALMGAADISATLGKRENAEKYRTRAATIKEAILTYLYDAATGTFVKLVRHEGEKLVYDRTIDMSSFHGLSFFGVLDPLDPRLISMRKAVDERIHVPTSYGGYMRYEGDNYYKIGADAPPNAWIITTLWMAQYCIRAAQSKNDLMRAYEILKWTHDRAGDIGVLPEQINPFTGAHLSTSPLVWSHSEYVLTVDAYIRKYRSLTK